MRISSSVFYSSSVGGILDQQSSIARLSQQLSTDNKLLSAADDPVAATQVMSLNNQIAQSTQYAANLQNVGQIQSEESTVLSQLQKDLTTIQQTLSGVNGGQNPSLNTPASATLSGLLKDVQSLANYQDTNGNYIFAGLQKGVQPYSFASGGATSYLGDANVRQVQIAQGQTVQVNDNLQTVMQPNSGDLLQAIDQASSALASNAPTAPAAVSSAYSMVGSALGNLQGLQAALAARQSQVQNQQDYNSQFLTINQNALSNLTQVDRASAIVELQQRQTSLQAAESAFASTSKLSVFNYL